MESARAILLRRSRFSESSLICVWMSPDLGKIKTSARGALKSGSALAGKIDLLYEADISFARSRRSEIHNLREVTVRTPFDGEGLRYANLAAGAYFAELVDRVTEPLGHSHEVFDVLHRAVGYLRTQPCAPKAIGHFEAELCRALGIHDDQGRHDPVHLLATHCGRPIQGRERALRACGDLARAEAEDKMTRCESNLPPET